MPRPSLQHAEASASPWWRRPVGLRGLLWVGFGLALLWSAAMAVAVWSFYRNWQVEIALRHQPVMLRLPFGLRSVAEVDEPMSVPLHARPAFTLNLNQTIQATLNQPLLARVKLQTELPISTTVSVQQDIPVQTVLHMQVPLRSWLPPVAVDLPVKITVPVRWQVPVQARVPVKLDVLVSGQIRQTLNVPVQASWKLRPHIDTRLHAQVVGQTAFVLKDGIPALPVEIEQADLRLPFNLSLIGAPWISGGWHP
jgi:hypothetical protein